ncbi:hypothetical protein TIFTF001_032609 [Ficus carica]|uniref:Uncharacterized protein n=1 Tax=Ficus carica TaxID=3494 RepID=A0AA88DXI2_FICCA|nr:hypothetical protein TIFTF001_032609 [Ficus carica]
MEIDRGITDGKPSKIRECEAYCRLERPIDPSAKNVKLFNPPNSSGTLPPRLLYVAENSTSDEMLPKEGGGYDASGEIVFPKTKVLKPSQRAKLLSQPVCFLGVLGLLSSKPLLKLCGIAPCSMLSLRLRCRSRR